MTIFVQPYLPAPMVPAGPISALVLFLAREFRRIATTISSIRQDGSAGSFLPVVGTATTAGVADGYLTVLVNGAQLKVPLFKT